MEKTVVISVRIPKELKEELEKYNINESEIIKSALINEVKKAKAKELERKLNEVKSILDKLPEDVSELIREDRER
ncbi:MAG: CopG family transcriptional regulator [Thermoproteota archaeon]|jgi:hypothetical protein